MLSYTRFHGLMLALAFSQAALLISSIWKAARRMPEGGGIVESKMALS